MTNQSLASTPEKRHGPALITLLGATNAGKTTIFNRLTGERSVIDKSPNTTRDRIYGRYEVEGQVCYLADTGGFTNDGENIEEVTGEIDKQRQMAIDEADAIIYVYDAIEGLSPTERQSVQRLARQKPLILVANKVDTPEAEAKNEELSYLGLPFVAVSGLHNRGMTELAKQLEPYLTPKQAVQVQPVVAIIGRPNVGKSSLLNALVGEERSAVSAQAGTTRDAVKVETTLDAAQLVLVDTAGVRRRGKIERGVESITVKRAMNIIARASAIVVVLDATEGLTRGDAHLTYLARDLGKPVVLVANKLDLTEQIQPISGHMTRFPILYISAKTGRNIQQVRDWLSKALQYQGEDEFTTD